MSAENKNLDKSEENSKPTSNSADDYEKSDKGENTASTSKLSSALNYFKYFPFAIKDAFASAFKVFRGRMKGVAPEEKEEKNKDDSIGGSSSPKETNGEGDEGETNEQETLSKSRFKNFSRPRIIVAACIMFIFIVSAIGFYIAYTPSSKEKGGRVISATSSEKDEGGFLDFVEDIIAPLRGKKPAESLTAEEKLQLLGIKYTEGEFVKQAGRNNTKAVDIFLRGGMNPNASRKSDGVTPLMAAASYDRVEMAAHLLDQGAAIDAVDNDGQTALMKAVKYNRPKVIELLLEKGANYTMADFQGNTALSIANEKHSDDILQAFSKFGIDVSTAKKEPPKELSTEKKSNLNEILSTNDYTKGEVSLEEMGQ